MEHVLTNPPWWIKGPVALLLAAVGSIPDLLPDWSKPHGPLLALALVAWIVLAFLWHAMNTWREKYDKPRLRLEPIHVIALGLLIAVGGLTWHLYRGSQPAALRTAQTTKSTAPLRPKYFAYDIEARIKAIDALDAALVKMFEIEKQGRGLKEIIGREVQDGTAPDSLLMLASRSKVVFDEFEATMRGIQHRLPEIAAIIERTPNNYIPQAVYTTSMSLRVELSRWLTQPAADRWQIIARTAIFGEWDQAVNGFAMWIGDKRTKLSQQRQEYATAEVYGPDER